eukprot:11448733-Alexandrium_andersonii.AAC.1
MTFLNSEITRLARQLDAARHELARTVSDRESVKEHQATLERDLKVAKSELIQIRTDQFSGGQQQSAIDVFKLRSENEELRNQ